MSDGRVFHVGCVGEFIYSLSKGEYVCDKCGLSWNGKEWKVAEYREPAQDKGAA